MSGVVGSVALAEQGRTLVQETFPHGLQHAAQLVPMLDALLTAQGWSPRELAHVYVSAGPGSFTGLRISVTLAKTMALATGVRIVAVPSLRVLAENAPADANDVMVVLDARRGHVFAGRFERNGNRWIEREPAHLAVLHEALQRAPRPIYLLGEGVAAQRNAIPQDPGIVIAPESTWAGRASVVASLGWEMAQRGEFTDADRLSPVYLRKPEAQEKYDAQRRGS